MDTNKLMRNGLTYEMARNNSQNRALAAYNAALADGMKEQAARETYRTTFATEMAWYES